MWNVGLSKPLNLSKSSHQTSWEFARLKIILTEKLKVHEKYSTLLKITNNDKKLVI